jgi:hypothetical protein
MDINTTEFANLIDEIVEQKVKKIVKQELNSFGNVRGRPATVESVNLDATINVQLPGETVVISNLKNKTGEVLATGSEVYLHSLSGLTNAYVAVKI